jgi:PKD repeat protein
VFKYIFLISLLITAAILTAGVQISGSEDSVYLSFDRSTTIQSEAKLQRVLALPAEDVELIIRNSELEIYSENGDLIDIRNDNLEDYVRISDQFVFREMRGFQIEIDLEKNSENRQEKLNKIDLEVRVKNPTVLPQKVSAAFLPLYRKLADNFDSSYLRNLEVQESKMLIVTHQQLLPAVQYFTDWKNARGIATEIVLKADIGNTSSQIKDYISNLYHSEEFPPDYLVITGDVDGQFAIPSFYINSGTENDVTDHPYSMLDGSDYFPEVLVGRMSVDTANQLQTIIAKVYYYEKQPMMNNTDWFENALIVAGNYSSSPPTPTTPVRVSMWLKDKMVDYGYQNVTELYYWPPNYNVYPGTAQINSALNNGVGIVTYRGWGDANGWHFPRYHVSDMNSGLSNGFYLPVVTSIVCNTGDFANQSVDPCFGENWLTMGTPTNPAGGVVFVGPSDLHTNTKFNNSIFSGIYSGLLDDDIFCFGSAVLHGKMELYHNFPMHREPGDKVEFYFHVYNILGDPSINVWTRVPEMMSIDLPSQISLGTSNLDIEAPGLDDAVVTAFKSGEVFAVERITNGQASLFFNMQTTGEMTITLTKPNHHPFIHNINVIYQNIDVGLESISTNPLIAGQNAELSLQLRNFGTQTATNVSATLTTTNSFVEISDPVQNFGNLAAGASDIQNYSFLLQPACPDNTIIVFDLEISTGSTAKFELVANSLAIEVSSVIILNDTGYLQPGESTDIQVEISNIGSFTTAGLSTQLFAETADITIQNGIASSSGIQSGESALVVFSISLSDQSYVGKNLPLRLEIDDANGLSTTAYFSLEAGLVDQYAPTGPDGYGYYAYDSHDRIYTESPVYNWIEIDPLEGGAGQVRELGDDVSFNVAMPFDFPYYGVASDSITICTNGWISMQTTWENYFRNWNIPSALGPYGCISPFWDDLIGIELSPDNHAPMRICYYYDTNQNIFIIEWNKCVNRFDNFTEEKVQIILYDPEYYPTLTGDGEIQFNYKKVKNIDYDNNYATVGIENFEQTDGLLITYANMYPASASPLEDGLSYKFTTDPPQYIPLTIPQPDFSAEITTGMYPLEIDFINHTDLMFPVNSYLWDFGDGNISTDKNPVHTYMQSGIFDVSLEVSNPMGSAIQFKENFITVLDPEMPEALFTVDSFGGITPVTINFLNSSTPNDLINTYYWDFGDSVYSTQINPTHVYDTPGKYSVKLIATNPIGSDTLTVFNLITVLNEDVEVWPGDTDCNGIVDVFDVLPVGIYWQQRGNQRNMVSMNWSAFDYPENWDVELAAFADCNGDGEVDIADILAICLNWGKTHSTIYSGSGLPADVAKHRDNFWQIYSSLNNSGKELELKNFLAETFDFPVVSPEFKSRLISNYPNPFNPRTTISFEIATEGKVELAVYNVKGQKVKSLINEIKPIGYFTADWNGKDDNGQKVASGLYFYSLMIDGRYVNSKKMILLK